MSASIPWLLLGLLQTSASAPTSLAPISLAPVSLAPISQAAVFGQPPPSSSLAEAEAEAEAELPSEAVQADTTTASSKLRILILPLESKSLDKEALSILEGRIANALAEDRGLDLLTHEDLSRMVELESQRALLGCDDSSCLEEVAGALGADLVIYGRVASLDENYILQLNSFRAVLAASGPRREVIAESVAVLARRAPIAAHSLVAELQGRDATMVFAEEPVPEPPASVFTASNVTLLLGLTTLGLGGALVVGGGALTGLGSALFFFPPAVPSKVLGQNLARGGVLALAIGGFVVVAGLAAATGSLFLE